MKKSNKFLTITASVVKKAVVAASGFASLGGVYQPKSPNGLEAFVSEYKAGK